MNPSSPSPAERARKYVAATLRAVTSMGQRPLADALEISEATVSRHISEGHFERAMRIVAEAGFKVVPNEMRCFNPKDVEVLLHGHRRWTEHLQSVDQLWQDE